MNITGILLFWAFGAVMWIVVGYAEHNRPLRLRDVISALFWPVVSVGTILTLFVYAMYELVQERQRR